MTPLIALALLVAYLLVSGEVFLATSVRGVFRMSFSGVGPTELRILLAIGTIALLRDPHVDLGVARPPAPVRFRRPDRHRRHGRGADRQRRAKRDRAGASGTAQKN